MYDNINILTGLTLEKFEVESNERILIQASGRKFVMYHSQDCCETVVIDSIDGKPERAIGEQIIDATEHTNRDKPKDEDYNPESFTWTYYTIRTQSETIVIRWYGTSNGYYSEAVDFEEVSS